MIETLIFHGYTLVAIHEAMFGLSLQRARARCEVGLCYHRTGECPVPPAETHVPNWVIRAYLRMTRQADFPYFMHRRTHKVSSAFRHNHAERVAPTTSDPLVTMRDGCGRDKRRRNDEHSQYGSTDKREYMRPRLGEREAIAAGLEDAREFADMEAVAEDGYPMFTREDTWDEERALGRISWCEMAQWMPEVDARACSCEACKARRLEIAWAEVSQAPEYTLADLMAEVPGGAPVAPEGWNEAVYAA